MLVGSMMCLAKKCMFGVDARSKLNGENGDKEDEGEEKEEKNRK